ncbi:MAG: TetR/AcrR family transcriptional regulator [Dissulfurispiraceae bacterium]
MGIQQKRAKYREEFRREILDEACELFITEGYERFTMRKLAGKIGYSPTTIYLYFKDRDALLLAICEEVAEQYLENLKHITESQTDPLQTLRQSLHCLIEFGFSNPHQYKVFFTTKTDVYGKKEEFMEKKSMAKESYLILRKIVQDCIDAGSLQAMDADVMTQSLAVAVQGLILMTMYRKSFPWADRNLLASALVNCLLRGYLK